MWGRVCGALVGALAASVARGLCLCAPAACPDARRLADLVPLAAQLTMVACVGNRASPLPGDASLDVSSLVQLRKLKWLHIEGAGWGGSQLPSDLSALGNLRLLWLPRNGLEGAIPGSLLQSLPALTSLDLSQNRLSGRIPDELGQLAHLRMLNLWRNALTGSVPSPIGNCARLEQLWLNDNALSGSLPASLSRLTRLTKLVLSGNAISGSVPALAGLSRLELLLLGTEGLCGPAYYKVGISTDLPPPGQAARACVASSPPAPPTRRLHDTFARDRGPQPEQPEQPEDEAAREDQPARADQPAREDLPVPVRQGQPAREQPEDHASRE
jgi:Leucine-rich repeat (LRR) protein